MTIDNNRTKYNKWASFYDEYPNPTVAIDEICFPLLYQNWSGHKVLEVGCGTGRHTERLFDQKNLVVGLDLSDGMLSKAKEKLPMAKFINEDFLTHNFGSAKFEKILMSLVLEHINTLDTFFEKIIDLLAHDGEFLFSELHPQRAMRGSFAHFKTSNDEEVELESFYHSEQDILFAAQNAGLRLNFTKDFRGNSDLFQINPLWAKYVDLPMIQVWSFFK